MRHLIAGVLFHCLLTAISSAHALTFRLPEKGDDLVGDLLVVETRYEDTFAMLARVYGLGFLEMLIANPDINPWVPGEGTEVTLPLAFVLPPAPREGVVLNLAEMRLYYYSAPDTVLSYPVGIGRQGWATPVTTTRVTGKVANPSWTPPDSVRKEHAQRGDILPPIVPPGPDNPLGAYAIQLAEPGYFLHGTNDPMGVGMRVSHGCVRLYDGDIEQLVRRLPKGTQVRIIDEPVKAGWHRGELYLEVHEPLAEKADTVPDYRAAIENALKERPGRNTDIDWNKVQEAVRESRGYPVVITSG